MIEEVSSYSFPFISNNAMKMEIDCLNPIYDDEILVWEINKHKQSDTCISCMVNFCIPHYDENLPLKRTISQ